jgi:glycosyltransferase involved in cell wall biosynthesis
MSVVSTVAVLIPAFCEERFIADVVVRVQAQDRVSKVLVVDDGSSDGTAARARSTGAELIVHPVNQGKGAAVQTGLRHFLEAGAAVEWVIMLDGDGQHRPEEIGRFLVAAAAQPKARLFVGNRMHDTRTMPLVRRLTNRLMSSQISLLCGQRIADTQCGFRMIHRTLIPLLLGRGAKFDYETEMLILVSWNGDRIADVPISTVYGEEVSSIHPVRDAGRFLKLMTRYWVRRWREKPSVAARRS